MGVSIKTAGGIAIGGIVGFYLLNKALNFAKQSITEITEASKWRAYYKHGCDGKMIPPGYSEMCVPGNEQREYVHPDVAEERRKQEKEEQRADQETRKTTDFKPIADSLERIAKLVLKNFGIDIDKKPEEAVEEAADTMNEIVNDRTDYLHVVKDENEDIHESIEEVFSDLDPMDVIEEDANREGPAIMKATDTDGDELSNDDILTEE